MVVETKSKTFQPFLIELAKYFMDFLETDFHKRRLPKRSITYKDRNGYRLGLNLQKYSTFEEKIWSIIKKGDFSNKNVSINRHSFTTNINKNSLDLINSQIDLIDEEIVKNFIDEVSEIIEQTVVSYKKDPDGGLNKIEDEVTSSMRTNIIKPLTENIETFIESQSSQGIESIYTIEVELSEIIYIPLSETIIDLFNQLLLGEEINISEKLITDIELLEMKNVLKNYFANFTLDDLYLDLQEIYNNHLIMDKKEIYLYICNIGYDNNKYPIFYIPIDIKKSQRTYQIKLDSIIYINKKALDYIVEKFNVEKDKKGRISSLSDRIIYTQEYEGGELLGYLQSILNDISDYFELEPTIQMNGDQKQNAKSILINISNSLYTCIFDKSDESLINDYEELLNILENENPLSEMFNNLVSEFILEEPHDFLNEVEERWDKLGTSDRLVPTCPIPLNKEQRNIIQALNNDKCNYILVEGPPGTGKSHTITAIIFDSILRNRSILVLSDKKEALDVVEEKITTVMNNARMGEEFQNPILRLGRAGNTYNKILSRQTINKIRGHYNVYKSNKDQIDSDINTKTTQLNSNIENEIIYSEKIKLDDLYKFSILHNEYESEEKRYDLDELTNGGPNTVESLDGLFIAIHELNSVINTGDYSISNVYQINFEEKLNKPQLLVFLELIDIAKTIRVEFDEYKDFTDLFDDFHSDQFELFKTSLNKIIQAGSGIFGLTFKWKELNEFNDEIINNHSYDGAEKPEKEIERIKGIYKMLKSINKHIEKNIRLNELEIDYYKIFHNLFKSDEKLLESIDPDNVNPHIKVIDNFMENYPLSSKSFGLNVNGNHQESIEPYYDNHISKMDNKTYIKIVEHVKLNYMLKLNFENIPQYDFKGDCTSIEGLITYDMTRKMDKKVLDFTSNNKNTAQTLKSIIRKKKRFPREEFEKLKNAFPCIIAGIRDFAEYIPLDQNIFDLIIIDEASQVSIAQAFPALLRAKKVIVLGDTKQFSNVKSSLARSDTNKTFLNNLKNTFISEVSKKTAAVEKMSKFNIKTSILEFFEHISNYEISLLKHFRGYSEHISYSSKYFYDGTLQAVRLNTKPIDEIIKFSFIEDDGKNEIFQNSNLPEIEFIIEELKKIKEGEEKLSVGIITPHTNQAKLASREISKLPESEYYYKDLKLKIMTFDSCQGEERDIVFYSMVANLRQDRLWGIFIKDLHNYNLESGGMIKAQRLNVGFSRVKECMHFVLSKPIEEFSGSIREALFHYHNLLLNKNKLPLPGDTDPKSPMEKKVITWINNTKFYAENMEYINVVAQFPVGEYLKQIDSYYNHPAYVVDFLLTYQQNGKTTENIIIEYDGFLEHFSQHQDVTEYNYKEYQNSNDIERQKTLEGYGYKFIRLNRFNTGNDPVEALEKRLNKIIKKKSIDLSVEKIKSQHEAITNKELKECPSCHELRPIAWFMSIELSSGIGRKCRKCVPSRSKVLPKEKPRSEVVTEHKQYITARPQKKTFSKENKHLDHIISIQSSKYCYQCGKNMIKKKSEYGFYYWRCSGYPRCRVTERCQN